MEFGFIPLDGLRGSSRPSNARDAATAPWPIASEPDRYAEQGRSRSVSLGDDRSNRQDVLGSLGLAVGEGR